MGGDGAAGLHTRQDDAILLERAEGPRSLGVLARNATTTKRRASSAMS